MSKTAKSPSGVTIRLTDERWSHIVEEHCELAGLQNDVLEAIALPQRVLRGGGGEFLAVRELEPGKALVVVFREVNAADGFIITAFLTRRLVSLNRRTQVWPPKS